jgi:hypothetical protein
MSRKANPYDNAIMESFFATLKTECFQNQIPKSRREAKLILFDYIETFYNRSRLHSTLQYQSPLEFENNFTELTTEQSTNALSTFSKKDQSAAFNHSATSPKFAAMRPAICLRLASGSQARVAPDASREYREEWRFSNLQFGVVDTDFVACSRFHRSCQFPNAN